MNKNPADILFTPRITEKAAYLSEQGTYVFDVAQNATKGEIAAAVKTLFKVTPRQVRIVAVPRKRMLTRGTNRMGQTAGGKKAYVFLKKGDTIDIA